MLRQFRQHLDGGRIDDELMVIGPEFRCRFPGIAPLVELLHIEADGKCLDLFSRLALHQPGDDRGIDSARQERAEGNVAAHAQSNRFRERFAESGLGRVERGEGKGLHLRGSVALRPDERGFPITANHRSTGRRIELGPMRGREFSIAVEHRLGMRHVLERHEIGDRLRVDLVRCAGDLQQRFEFAGEGDAAGGDSINERLLSHAVSREEQLPMTVVPDREGEHAAQMLDAVVTPLLVGVNDALGVARRAEAMAECFELRLQFAVVVDLAIECDPHRTVFIRERLMSAREIDDREPPVPECRAARSASVVRRKVVAIVIRPAMAQYAGHSAQHGLGERFAFIRPTRSRDTAHCCSLVWNG